MDNKIANFKTAEERSEWLKKNEEDYKSAVDKSLALGLDLQGGMYVTMEIGVEDLLKALAGKNVDSTFTGALRKAKELQQKDQSNFIDLFSKALKEKKGDVKLANYFSGQPPRPAFGASDNEVTTYLKKEVETVVENSFTVLRTRIDQFGVVSPNIQKVEGSNRILLELPGVKDAKRVRQLLRSTAKLEFWATYTFKEMIPSLVKVNDRMKNELALASGEVKPEVKDTTKSNNKDSTKVASADKSKDSAAKTPTPSKADTANLTDAQKTEKAKKENPFFMLLNPTQEGQASENTPEMGVALSSDTAKVNKILNDPNYRLLLPPDVKFCWGAKPKVENTQIIALYGIKSTPDGQAQLTGERVTDTSVEPDPNTNQNGVSMAMDTEGAKIWKNMTEQNLRRSIAVVLDNLVYSAPTVQSVIAGGRSSITGTFTYDEAKDLANVLKAGKLPAPARIVGEEQVGPSLGADTINAGIISFFLGFISVVVFMWLYYGKAGLIADLALLFNLVFLIAICSALNVVLTLPGIAGIVLTMGMAADANILIYERIREELNAGKSLKGAVQEGFSNALSAIVDGNLTTFITGLVLFLFGTGIIRGFAVTMMIGIITTLITGLVFTRLILDYVLDRPNIDLSFGNRAATRFFNKLDFSFISKRKTSYAVCGIVTLVSLGAMVALPPKLGVDFKGGRQYVIQIDKQVAVSELDILREDLKVEFKGADPEVKTLGTTNQLMITSSYKIEDPNADTEVEAALVRGVQKKNPSFTAAGIIKNTSVGPTVARDVIQAAYYSVIFSLIAMFIYIFARFAKWQYGIGALISLMFNVIVCLGFYWIIGYLDVLPFSVEINQTLIAALLTIVGYTINDTVIIFDRIRENIVGDKLGMKKLEDIFYTAIKDTLSRTIVTVVTVILTILMMFIFGGDVLRGFMLSMMMGIIIGTLSSIFLAAPITLDLIKLTDSQPSNPSTSNDVVTETA